VRRRGQGMALKDAMFELPKKHVKGPLIKNFQKFLEKFKTIKRLKYF